MQLYVSLLLLVLCCAQSVVAGEQRASELLLETLLAYDGTIARRSVDELPPFDGESSVIEAQGGFHFRVAGDHFEQIRTFLQALCGSPLQEGVGAEDEVRSARYLRFSLVSVPSRNETVVFGLVTRLPAPADGSDSDVEIVDVRDERWARGVERPLHEGWIVMRYQIGYYGGVESAEVLSASDSGYATFGPAFLRACRFAPAFRNGRPIVQLVKQKFTFEELEPLPKTPPQKQEEKKGRRTRRYRQPR